MGYIDCPRCGAGFLMARTDEAGQVVLHYQCGTVVDGFRTEQSERCGIRMRDHETERMLQGLFDTSH